MQTLAHNKMNNILSIGFILVTISLALATDSPFYYVSPGIGIEFGKNITIIPKISFGSTSNVNSLPYFGNFTIGFHIDILKEYINRKRNNYAFIEIEYGKHFEINNIFFFMEAVLV